MSEVMQEPVQEASDEQYIIVYPDRVIGCPQDVRTFVQVCEFQNAHMRESEPELFSLRLSAFRGIQDTIRSLQHCTSSFSPESVWLGFGHMDEWVQIAGFFDPKEGDAFDCAVDAFESRGLNPAWICNLDCACRIFLRDPQELSF